MLKNDTVVGICIVITIINAGETYLCINEITMIGFIFSDENVFYMDLEYENKIGVSTASQIPIF